MCTIPLEDKFTEGGCEDVDWHRAWDPKRELNLNLNPNVNLLVSNAKHFLASCSWPGPQIARQTFSANVGFPAQLTPDIPMTLAA